MSKILLISPQTLKDEYTFDDNIEDKYIVTHIGKCQDFIIKPLLGEVKYDEILTQISGSVLSASNTTLVEEYIQPIIAYFVMAETVYSTAYKLKNIGLEGGDASRYGELVKISQKYMRDCDTYQQILSRYVCLEGISTVQEKATINAGIYLGSGDYRNLRETPGR